MLDCTINVVFSFICLKHLQMISVCLILESARNSLLREIYLLVKDGFDKMMSDKPNVPALLLVDDISVLTSVGCSVFSTCIFVRYLQSLAMSAESCMRCMACLVSTTDDSSSHLLSSLIGHQADVILCVQTLKTGYCKDLTGEVCMECILFYC